MRFLRVLVPASAVVFIAACTVPAPPDQAPPSSAPPTTSSSSWQVGATPLPLRSDGFGQVQPTPPELANRSLPTEDRLPPPRDDEYDATIAEVPTEVLERSTWKPACPVAASDLRYLTMSFWGFDGRAHTGEMIVNVQAATGVTKAFRWLYEAKFPIEEMRVVPADELDAAPTGDGNNTTAFVCRNAVTLNKWSAHAYGLAVDLNPFCNPYVRGDLVLPELSSSYLDRGHVRPGMIQPGDAAVRAFAAIGWSWGGEWSSPLDLQHFTATGD